MTQGRPSQAPLVLMCMWYLLLAAGSFVWFFVGILFGSEAYRDRGIPLIEWGMIAGPLLMSVALLIATIVLWNRGRRRETYWLCAGSSLLAMGLVGYSGLLGL
jgi:uncharacterized protein with PQ loop repeat